MLWFLLIFLTILSSSGFSFAGEYKVHSDPAAYVLEKLKTHDIVFLGEYHQQPRIISFVSDLVPGLQDAGVTHIGLEIASDQQDELDHFLQSGNSLSIIKIPPMIDCHDYRDLLTSIQKIDQKIRPVVSAIDMPLSDKEPINRDEYMTRSIIRIQKANPKMKMFVIIGNMHILKKFEWEYTVVEKRRSITESLKVLIPGIRTFSITQIIGRDPKCCDFTREFGGMDDAVAVDCDGRFDGWKMGIQSVLAIKPAGACELVDGMIVY